MIAPIVDRVFIAAGIIGLMLAAASGRLVQEFPAELRNVDIALYGYSACVACLGFSLVLTLIYPTIRRRMISGGAWAAMAISMVCMVVIYGFGDRARTLFGLDVRYVLVTCAILTLLSMLLLVLEPVKLRQPRRQPRSWRMPPEI